MSRQIDRSVRDTKNGRAASTGRYVVRMAHDDIGFPPGSPDEEELLLQWLGYFRGAVIRNVDGLDDRQAPLATR